MDENEEPLFTFCEARGSWADNIFTHTDQDIWAELENWTPVDFDAAWLAATEDPETIEALTSSGYQDRAFGCADTSIGQALPVGVRPVVDGADLTELGGRVLHRENEIAEAGKNMTGPLCNSGIHPVQQDLNMGYGSATTKAYPSTAVATASSFPDFASGLAQYAISHSHLRTPLSQTIPESAPTQVSKEDTETMVPCYNENDVTMGDSLPELESVDAASLHLKGLIDPMTSEGVDQCTLHRSVAYYVPDGRLPTNAELGKAHLQPLFPPMLPFPDHRRRSHSNVSMANTPQRSAISTPQLQGEDPFKHGSSIRNASAFAINSPGQTPSHDIPQICMLEQHDSSLPRLPACALTLRPGAEKMVGDVENVVHESPTSGSSRRIVSEHCQQALRWQALQRDTFRQAFEAANITSNCTYPAHVKPSKIGQVAGDGTRKTSEDANFEFAEFKEAPQDLTARQLSPILASSEEPAFRAHDTPPDAEERAKQSSNAASDETPTPEQKQSDDSPNRAGVESGVCEASNNTPTRPSRQISRTFPGTPLQSDLVMKETNIGEHVLTPTMGREIPSCKSSRSASPKKNTTPVSREGSADQKSRRRQPSTTKIPLFSPRLQQAGEGAPETTDQKIERAIKYAENVKQAARIDADAPAPATPIQQKAIQTYSLTLEQLRARCQDLKITISGSKRERVRRVISTELQREQEDRERSLTLPKLAAAGTVDSEMTDVEITPRRQSKKLGSPSPIANKSQPKKKIGRPRGKSRPKSRIPTWSGSNEAAAGPISLMDNSFGAAIDAIRGTAVPGACIQADATNGHGLPEVSAINATTPRQQPTAIKSERAGRKRTRSSLESIRGPLTARALAEDEGTPSPPSLPKPKRRATKTSPQAMAGCEKRNAQKKEGRPTMTQKAAAKELAGLGDCFSSKSGGVVAPDTKRTRKSVEYKEENLNRKPKRVSGGQSE